MDSFYISVVVGAVSSLILKFAPASWKGKPMLAIAVALAFVFSVGQLAIAGKLNKLSWSDPATFAAVVAGQAVFYAALKDNLRLADPPVAAPKPVAPPAAPAV
jgi:hypothetical protein